MIKLNEVSNEVLGGGWRQQRINSLQDVSYQTTQRTLENAHEDPNYFDITDVQKNALLMHARQDAAMAYLAADTAFDQAREATDVANRIYWWDVVQTLATLAILGILIWKLVL